MSILPQNTFLPRGRVIVGGTGASSMNLLKPHHYSIEEDVKHV